MHFAQATINIHNCSPYDQYIRITNMYIDFPERRLWHRDVLNVRASATLAERRLVCDSWVYV